MVASSMGLYLSGNRKINMMMMMMMLRCYSSKLTEFLTEWNQAWSCVF